jgi:hypothetical protein
MMISQATFHRASRAVVLHAVTDKCRDLSIVTLDGNLNFDFSFRSHQQLAHAGGQIQDGCRFFKVLFCGFKSALHVRWTLLSDKTDRRENFFDYHWSNPLNGGFVRRSQCEIYAFSAFIPIEQRIFRVKSKHGVRLQFTTQTVDL